MTYCMLHKHLYFSAPCIFKKHWKEPLFHDEYVVEATDTLPESLGNDPHGPGYRNKDCSRYHFKLQLELRHY